MSPSVVLPILAAGCLGLVWGQESTSLLALALFLPLVWGECRSRVHAWAAAALYYLAVARGVPQGIAVFFGEGAHPAFGVALWLVSSTLLALPWSFLLPSTSERSFGGVAVRLGTIFVLLGAPPLGIIGWGNPLLAAGVLFPGLGWMGMALAFALAVCSVCGNVPVRILLASILVAGALSPASIPASASGWTAVDSHYGRLASGSCHDFAQEFDRIRSFGEFLRKGDADVTAMPETTCGLWTSAARRLWRPVSEDLARSGRTALLGVEIPLQDGGYENCVVAIGAEEQMVRQRVPVPVSMWRPWRTDGARADFLGSGTLRLRGKAVAVLICYEQVLVWPALRSMATRPRPEILLGVSNQWWAHGTCIPNIQRQCLEAWARLFGLRLVTAVND